jgi:AraC-like DNA-binding protein
METLTALHAVRPGLPIVIVSALNVAAAAATAMRHGAVDYVTKPFENEMLLRVVRGTLGQKGTPQRAADGAPPRLAVIGCHDGLVAGLAATLHAQVNVVSYMAPPADFAVFQSPAWCVVETAGKSVSWLDCVAELLERYPAMRAVKLADPCDEPQVHLVLGERGVTVERPFQLTALLDLVCTALLGPKAGRAWRDPRTASVIDAVWCDPAGFRVDRFADRIGVSVRHLSRSFHRHAGMSIAAYVRRVRVHAAIQLIERRGEKTDAVAQAVGFHDASHLSRAFVKLTGRRPGRHRPGRASPRD